jgi:TPR repeat protein
MFNAASEKGHANSQFNLGYLYEKGLGVEQNYDLAKDYYLQAAKQNESNAQTNLGLMYLNGQGVPVNLKKAQSWFSLGAQQGHPESQYYMGYILLNHQNQLEEAKVFFDKSCLQGFQPSCKAQI